MDTFNLICYLPWFLSVITKRDNFRTRSSDDEGTLTKRHFSQLLPGYQAATLVIMFTKWPLMKDLKRNFADTPRTQNPPQALDYSVLRALTVRDDRIRLMDRSCSYAVRHVRLTCAAIDIVESSCTPRSRMLLDAMMLHPHTSIQRGGGCGMRLFGILPAFNILTQVMLGIFGAILETVTWETLVELTLNHPYYVYL